MLLSDGVTKALWRGLIIGLIVAAVRGAIWLLRHASNRTIAIASTALLSISIGIYVAAPQETDYRRLAQNPEVSLYRYSAFLKKHPHSYRIGAVDDLLWNWAAKMEAPGPSNQYLETFPSGRHASELRALIAARKASDLTALRTKPAAKMAARFTRWFPDAAEIPEVHRILLAAIEQQGMGTPPPGIVRRLIESYPSSKIPYSVAGFEGAAGEFAQEIRNRLTGAFRPFGVVIEEKQEEAAIRVEGTVQVDKSRSYRSPGSDVHGAYPEIAKARFGIYLPGETHPAWSGELQAESPDAVEKDAPAQSDVRVSTLIAFRQALQKFFRYWEP